MVDTQDKAATRHDVPADEISRACVHVERYFQQALPLHVADAQYTGEASPEATKETP
jgi:hypothetical protein